jgi:hypothetical protein
MSQGSEVSASRFGLGCDGMVGFGRVGGAGVGFCGAFFLWTCYFVAARVTHGRQVLLVNSLIQLIAVESCL